MKLNFYVNGKNILFIYQKLFIVRNARVWMTKNKKKKEELIRVLISVMIWTDIFHNGTLNFY